MHVFGAFELEVQPGSPDNPASVRVALLRYTRGEDGRLFVTPECTSLGEVEGQINSLQDELDELRERARSEEHTSELQSRQYLVCRLLLEKKKKPILSTIYH